MHKVVCSNKDTHQTVNIEVDIKVSDTVSKFITRSVIERISSGTRGNVEHIGLICLCMQSDIFLK